MTSRERVLTALKHEEPDRVPIDFGGTNCSTIHRIAHCNLMKLMGYNDHEEDMYDIIQQVVRPDPRLLKQFGNDCYLILPGVGGDWKLEIIEDEKYRYFKDEWGVEYRMPHDGFYFDIYKNPLEHISLKDLKHYRWPNGDDKGRVKNLRSEAKKAFSETDYILIISDGIWGMMQHSSILLGFHRLYECLASDTKFVTAIMEKLLEYEFIYWETVLTEVKNYVHIAHLSDDLGGQFGPNINPRTYKKVIKPFHKQLIEYIKRIGDIKILFHSCGSIYEFIPDFIEMGVDILNPVQISASGMDPKILKREFGKDIVFWGGGVDTQRVLPMGAPEEVALEVVNRIRDFAPGGGFVFTPVHNIQPNVPAINIETMFETALEYGKYPIKDVFNI